MMIGSSDINRSKQFYDATLAVLGAGEPMPHINSTGQQRYFYIHGGSTFCLTEPINGQPASPSNGTTIGFACNSLEQVEELHAVALANGGVSVEGPPGPREGDTGVINLCYFLDPDGHKICGLHRPT